MHSIRWAAACALAATLAACASSTTTSTVTTQPSVATWAKEASGGLLVAEKGSVVDPACANQRVDYEVQPLEIGHQIPAILIVKSGSSCLGKAGQASEVFVKAGGRWTSQFKSGGDVRPLPTRTAGVQDLGVDDGSSCKSEWHWQGGAYEISKRCP